MRLGGRDPGEEIKMSVFQRYLAPEAMREHLLLQAARLKSLAEMKVETESWLSAHEGAEATAMEIGAVEWGTRKDGKGKGKRDQPKGKGGENAKYVGAWWAGYADNKGKEGGKGEKNANWNQGKANWTDKKWTSAYFAGYCSYCRRWGHKKLECSWYKQKLSSLPPAERKKREEMREAARKKEQNKGAGGGAGRPQNADGAAMEVGAIEANSDTDMSDMEYEEEDETLWVMMLEHEMPEEPEEDVSEERQKPVFGSVEFEDEKDQANFFEKVKAFQEYVERKPVPQSPEKLEKCEKCGNRVCKCDLTEKVKGLAELVAESEKKDKVYTEEKTVFPFPYPMKAETPSANPLSGVVIPQKEKKEVEVSPLVPKSVDELFPEEYDVSTPRSLPELLNSELVMGEEVLTREQKDEKADLSEEKESSVRNIRIEFVATDELLDEEEVTAVTKELSLFLIQNEEKLEQQFQNAEGKDEIDITELKQYFGMDGLTDKEKKTVKRTVNSRERRQLRSGKMEMLQRMAQRRQDARRRLEERRQKAEEETDASEEEETPEYVSATEGEEEYLSVATLNEDEPVPGAEKRRPIADSGAVGNVCPLMYDKHNRPNPAKARDLRSVTGQTMKFKGERTVRSRVLTAKGKRATMEVKYNVGNVTRPVLSVSHGNDEGKAFWFTLTSAGVCKMEDFHFHIAGDFMPLTRRSGVFELEAELIPKPPEHGLLAGIEE